jgi:glucose/arabinose dehydrogenase
MRLTPRLRLLKYISIGFLLVVICIFGIFKAREYRVWPFNSGLSKVLPPQLKWLAYRLTAPREKLTKSYLYDIEIHYDSIPDMLATGGGGAINQFQPDKILVTLNNGQNYLFDQLEKSFYPIPSKNIKESLSSVRDALIFTDSGNTYLAILATKDSGNTCKTLSLNLLEVDLNEIGKNFNLTNQREIWRAEPLCEDPVDADSGGRVLYEDGYFYISTGHFIGGGHIQSASMLPQDINSSYGKVIKLAMDGKSKILTSGHRSPQGLFFSPKNNILFATEHSMRGGDELNLIHEGGNYGWPCEAYTTPYEYDFSKPQKTLKLLRSQGDCVDKDFSSPSFLWPAWTGISQGLTYEGEAFPAFNDDLIIGSLGAHSIFHLVLSEDVRVIFSEKIDVFERIRDLIVDDTGKIVILTDSGSLLTLDRHR